MAIDKSGKWWRGTEPGDLAELVADYAPASRPVSRVTLASCAQCAGIRFGVGLDDEAGCVERLCLGCGGTALMLDSVDTIEEAELAAAACPCGGEEFNVAVGFSIDADQEVRWVYLGLRCLRDGVLGVYCDWKIDYTPTAGLLAAV